MASAPPYLGAIIFLNPAVVLPLLGPQPVAGLTVYGLRNAPPQTNGSIDRLNALGKTIAAGVVATNLAQLGDVRGRLWGHGLKLAFPAAWFTDPTLDVADGITAWLAANGTLPGVVVDRPGVGPAGMPSIGVGAGTEITAAACAAIAALFAPLMN